MEAQHVVWFPPAGHSRPVLEWMPYKDIIRDAKVNFFFYISSKNTDTSTIVCPQHSTPIPEIK